MNQLDQQLAAKLAERQQAGNLRALPPVGAGVDFFSNDYLGLSTSGLINRLMIDKYDHPGTSGSTGSRLLSGNNPEAEALEERIARFHKAETALLFNSGYDANMGLVSAIAGRHTTILYDELCHASIIDGVRLSRGTSHFKFRHNDLTDLAERLERYNSSGPAIVIVESIYSMDGDAAPLTELAELCTRYGAALIVDEAHATGVFGPDGRGLVCALGLADKVFARVHTFGKALGCHGAAVVGSASLKQYLINFARSFIYTTALPGHSLRAINCAYSYLGSKDFSNGALHGLVRYFNKQKRAAGEINWGQSTSPIQVWMAGSNEKSRVAAAALQNAGLQVKAILSPTVPKGTERLRICLHSFNTTEQVDVLMETIKQLN